MTRITIEIDSDCPRHHRRPTRVLFGVPYLINPANPERRKPILIKIPNDAIATVPLLFIDAEGHQLASGDTANVSAAVSDPTLATAAVTTDGNWVQITPQQASGAGTITYTDANQSPALVATLDFSIVTPQPTAAQFNEGATVFTPNPTPPAGAPGGPAAGTTTLAGGAGGTDTTAGGAGGTTTLAGAGG